VSATIVVEGLGKAFRRYDAHRPRTLKEAFVRRFRDLGRGERFCALHELSFEVEPGQILGIVGSNGAGKSTLLRLLGGVGRPDRGRMEIRGRVAALLELGAGFHPELTGRENVFVSGVIAGLSRRQVSKRLDSIVAFAELERFIDSPLRTYSTGMQMRLGFAIGVHTTPDILLIDEVLAVGDLAFQKKCLERVRQFKAEGCTIVLVSHDTGQIQQLCDRALWLQGGRLAAMGDPEEVVKAYIAEMETETRRHTPGDWPARATPTGGVLRVNDNRFGSMALEITSVRLLDRYGRSISALCSGDALNVEIEYAAAKRIESPILGVKIVTEEDQPCVDLTTAAAGVTLSAVRGEGRITLRFERLDLNGGQYYLDVGAYPPEWTPAYDYHWHAYPLQVSATGQRQGVLYPPHRWEVGSAQVVELRQR
jgi:lipopolysaccharide transport system ATP-binding protein